MKPYEFARIAIKEGWCEQDTKNEKLTFKVKQAEEYYLKLIEREHRINKIAEIGKQAELNASFQKWLDNKALDEALKKEERKDCDAKIKNMKKQLKEPRHA
jgi:hypothetical protein